MLKEGDILYYYSDNNSEIKQIVVTSIDIKDYVDVAYIHYKHKNKNSSTERVLVTDIKGLNNIDMSAEGSEGFSSKCIISTNKNELINGIIRHNKKEIKIWKELIRNKEKENEKLQTEIK